MTLVSLKYINFSIFFSSVCERMLKLKLPKGRMIFPARMPSAPLREYCTKTRSKDWLEQLCWRSIKSIDSTEVSDNKKKALTHKTHVTFIRMTSDKETCTHFKRAITLGVYVHFIIIRDTCCAVNEHH